MKEDMTDQIATLCERIQESCINGVESVIGNVTHLNLKKAVCDISLTAYDIDCNKRICINIRLSHQQNQYFLEYRSKNYKSEYLSEIVDNIVEFINDEWASSFWIEISSDLNIIHELKDSCIPIHIPTRNTVYIPKEYIELYESIREQHE